MTAGPRLPQTGLGEVVVKRLARPVQELTDGVGRGSQSGRDLVVAATLERKHHDRFTLTGWQCSHGGDHVAEVLSLLKRLVWPERVLAGAVGTGRPPRLRAQQVQRDMMGNHAQPGRKRSHPLSTDERAAGPGQSLLHGLLGVSVSDDARAMAYEPLPVTHHDRLECCGGAIAGQLGEPHVAQRRQL
jgi:hypothetical protein